MFNSPKPPSILEISYIIVKVDIYIPNPLWCYNYQKFGHQESQCTRAKICKTCGKDGSDNQEPICHWLKCVNCQKDLHKTGNKGNIAIFIKNLLSHWNFTVWHGNASSDLYKQETGVPQGSIFSVTLFILNCYTFILLNISHYLFFDTIFISICKAVTLWYLFSLWLVYWDLKV